MFDFIKRIFTSDKIEENILNNMADKLNIEQSQDNSFGINFKQSPKELKEATKLKNEGRIQEACNLLLSVKEKLDINTKLALYLQQAGRYEESMIEIKRLIDITPENIKDTYRKSCTTKEIKNGIYNHYSNIFDKARLINQKEKKPKQMIYFYILNILTNMYSLNISDTKYSKKDLKEIIVEEIEHIEDFISKSLLKYKMNISSDLVINIINTIKVFDYTEESVKNINIEIADLLKLEAYTF